VAVAVAALYFILSYIVQLWTVLLLVVVQRE